LEASQQHGTLSRVQGRELTAREAALTPPRAHGTPLATVLLRATPEDFVVEEDLGFAPAGCGQHLLLRVRKRNANTQWVARELARIAVAGRARSVTPD